jgi:hypothetical protein
MDRPSLGGETSTLKLACFGVDTGATESQQIHFLTGLNERGGSTDRLFDLFGGVKSSSDNCGILFLIKTTYRIYKRNNMQSWMG